MHADANLRIDYRGFVRPDGEKVVRLRALKGWTQERLAEKSSLSVRTVQNIERGRPSQVGTVVKVAFALGVEPKECVLSPALAGTEYHIRKDSGKVTSATGIPDCPYRGLLPFRETDQSLLFGREQVIDHILAKIGHNNVIQVSGPSGSGKSSLIAAGLIPATKKLLWCVLCCRPGSDPFGSLAGALIPTLEPELDEISRAARLPELIRVIEAGQLSYLLARRLPDSSHNLLLFIDQFEELYTQCASQEIRRRYLDALLSLARSGHDAGRRQVTLLYAIRADFASRLLSYREFIDAIQDADVKIGPMTREELDSAIRKPALCHGVQFEAGLVERILDDAGREPGTLPLVEFALTELWEKRNGTVLTHTAYDEVGQLSGAIAKRAETIFRSLTPLEQESARRVLTQLVHVAEDGGDDTRQRCSLGLLYAQEHLGSETGRKVLDVLTAARLLTVGLGDDVRKGEAVEIAHEALIRRWPRFGQWLAEDREILVWRQRTRVLISGWQESGRDDGLLLRGPLLDEAKLWAARVGLSFRHRRNSSSPRAQQPRTRNVPIGPSVPLNSCLTIQVANSLHVTPCGGRRDPTLPWFSMRWLPMVSAIFGGYRST